MDGIKKAASLYYYYNFSITNEPNLEINNQQTRKNKKELRKLSYFYDYGFVVVVVTD